MSSTNETQPQGASLELGNPHLDRMIPTFERMAQLDVDQIFEIFDNQRDPRRDVALTESQTTLIPKTVRIAGQRFLPVVDLRPLHTAPTLGNPIETPPSILRGLSIDMRNTLDRLKAPTETQDTDGELKGQVRFNANGADVAVSLQCKTNTAMIGIDVHRLNGTVPKNLRGPDLLILYRSNGPDKRREHIVLVRQGILTDPVRSDRFALDVMQAASHLERAVGERSRIRSFMGITGEHRLAEPSFYREVAQAHATYREKNRRIKTARAPQIQGDYTPTNSTNLPVEEIEVTGANPTFRGDLATQPIIPDPESPSQPTETVQTLPPLDTAEILRKINKREATYSRYAGYGSQVEIGPGITETMSEGGAFATAQRDQTVLPDHDDETIEGQIRILEPDEETEYPIIYITKRETEPRESQQETILRLFQQFLEEQENMQDASMLQNPNQYYRVPYQFAQPETTAQVKAIISPDATQPVIEPTTPIPPAQPTPSSIQPPPVTPARSDSATDLPPRPVTATAPILPNANTDPIPNSPQPPHIEQTAHTDETTPPPNRETALNQIAFSDTVNGFVRSLERKPEKGVGGWRAVVDKYIEPVAALLSGALGGKLAVALFAAGSVGFTPVIVAAAGGAVAGAIAVSTIVWLKHRFRPRESLFQENSQNQYVVNSYSLTQRIGRLAQISGKFRTNELTTLESYRFDRLNTATLTPEEINEAIQILYILRELTNFHSDLNSVQLPAGVNFGEGITNLQGIENMIQHLARTFQANQQRVNIQELRTRVEADIEAAHSNAVRAHIRQKLPKAALMGAAGGVIANLLFPSSEGTSFLEALLPPKHQVIIGISPMP